MKDFDKNFEKNLSDKMSELSDNVNCFDKISKKAFPENNGITEDGYYCESGLENVTGKRRFSFTPVLTIAFVVFLGSLLLMQTNIKEFFYQIKQNSNNQYYNTFSDIKSELDYELENFSYSYYDLTFDEYQMNIGCINPFAQYPLIRESEDTKVRVYTKVLTIDSELTETNQIYLVHYTDDYCGENIISITDTKAKFTRDEQNNAAPAPTANISWDVIFPPAYSSFKFFHDSDMNYPFEIKYKFLYKDGDNVYNLLTSCLFWFDSSDKDPNTKHYSILSMYNDYGSMKILNTGDLWNETVYQYDEHNGFETAETLFIKEDIANDVINQYPDGSESIFLSSLNNNNSYDSQINAQARSISVKFHSDIITKKLTYLNNLNFNNRNSTSEQYDSNFAYFDYDTIKQIFDEEIVFETSTWLANSELENLQSEFDKLDSQIDQINAQYSEITALAEELKSSDNIDGQTKERINFLENQKKELSEEINRYNNLNFEIIDKVCRNYIETNYSLDDTDFCSSYTDNPKQNGVYVETECVYTYNLKYNQYNQIEFTMRLQKNKSKSDWKVMDIILNISD